MGRGAAISERLFTFPLYLHGRSNTARCNGKHLVHLHRMPRLTFNSPRINSTVASLNTAFHRLTTLKQCFISFSLLATDYGGLRNHFYRQYFRLSAYDG
ncbi:hypothetical protein T08_7513 [Trichinella sp. T8]|nr:hypothetical protein T08_7513 [Trichinella sp. T8]